MTAEPLSIEVAAATATSETISRRVRRARTRLLCKMEQESLWLAHHRMEVAAIGTGPSDDVRNLDCAKAALRAYSARVALEEVESALVRIDNGVYGRCTRCNASISIERLDSTPEAKCCADCDAIGGAR